MKGVVESFEEVRYKIGTEIETTIDGYLCNNCSYCLICDDCPVCEECYNDNNCDNCDRCEDCDYIYSEDYCPIRDDYILNKSKIYIERVYEDQSCGLEFSTKTFSSLKDYHKALKTIINEIGTENIKIRDLCGGHINISWECNNYSWADFDETIAQNMLYFSDLLTYMFCSKYTYYREQYKVFPQSFDDVISYIHDKYTCVHIKDYAIEIRFPDSPKAIDNHVLLSAVLLALSFKTKEIKQFKYEFNITKQIYNKINRDGKRLTKDEKNYLRRKYKMLKKLILTEMQQFSKEMNTNLIRALDFRFKYPKTEYGAKVKFRFKNFPINGKRTMKISDYIIKPENQLVIQQFI